MRPRPSLLILLVLGLAASAARPARAQASLGFGGGVTYPVGDFHTAYTSGYNLLTTIDLHAPGVPLGFRVDGMYNRFGGNGQVFGSAAPHSQIWAITGNLVVNLVHTPGDLVVPYFIGGAGYYNSSFENFLRGSTVTIPGVGSTHTADFGINGGVGVRFDVGTLRLFVEGRYHNVLGGHSPVRLIPLTVGVTFGG